MHRAKKFTFHQQNFQFSLLNLSQMNHYRLYVFQSFIAYAQRTFATLVFRLLSLEELFRDAQQKFCHCLISGVYTHVKYSAETLKLIKGLNISHQLALEVRKIVEEFPQKASTARSICIFQ